MSSSEGIPGRVEVEVTVDVKVVRGILGCVGDDVAVNVKAVCGILAALESKLP